MAVVPRHALADFFGLFPPTHVLGTTYTLSLAFFEALVYPKIRDRSALRRCVLLADRTGFQRALVEAGALQGVGRNYMVASVPCAGSFHPKVWLALGDDQAAVLAGSGNLTQSGFMGNAELFDAVHLRKGGPHRAVAEGVVAFLAGLSGQWAACPDRTPLLLEAITEMRGAMGRLAASMPVEDDPPVRFLSSYCSDPLVDQLAPAMGQGTLSLAAPYFGGSTAGLDRLRGSWKPRKVRVFPAVHAADTLDVPLQQLRALKAHGVSAHRLAVDPDERFAHLKVYGSDGPNGCWVFTTSANCTDAAFGGRNVEAGLLRRVSPGVLRSYFPTASDGPLPAGQRSPGPTGAGRWLPLFAAERAGGVELTAAATDLLPLRDVELTLRLAGRSQTVPRAVLFEGASSARLVGAPFSAVAACASAPPLLSLKGISAGGSPVEGAAFVDRPMILTSDPAHRSAWQAVQAILGDDGLPEAADLACVFQLVNGVFDRPSEPAPPASGGGPPAAGEMQEAEDKTAFWPPVTDALPPPSSGRGHGHPVYWFRKILDEMLRPPAGTEVDGAAGGGAAGGWGGDEESAQPGVAPRAAKSLWGHAGGSFEALVERLGWPLESAEAARRVWPLAVSVLLVTLAVRRQLARYAGDELGLPAAGELVARFLRAVFDDRRSDEGEPVGEPLASDLRTRFRVAPAPDITEVLLLLFAYHHASAPHLGLEFLLTGWLAFRAALDVPPESPPAGAAVQFRRFLADNRVPIDWPAVEASLAALAAADWSAHPGFRDLAAFAAQAALGPDAPVTLPAGFGDRWDQTCRWVRLGRRWYARVKRLRPLCPAKGCPRQYRVEPDNRRLTEFRPTICRGCGTVLVPEQLVAEYEARHGRLP